MQELAYVNDAFCPLDQARVSIEDRGFLFADGVYEVIISYGGKPFRLPEHLERLRRSLELVSIAFDVEAAGVADIVQEGIRKSGWDRTQVYMQVTRGVAPREHPFPKDAKPTFVAFFRQPRKISPDKREKGIRLIAAPDFRWDRCYIKSIALLPNVLAKQGAIDAGADDAVFVTPDCLVHEATAANVFMIKDGRGRTPDKNQRILHGITRQSVLECAQALNIPIDETPVRMDELQAADEVFITSTTVEILGVVELDGRPIGNGNVGPLTRAIHEQFTKTISSHA